MSSQQIVLNIDEMLQSILDRHARLKLNEKNALLELDLQMQDLRYLYLQYEQLRNQGLIHTPHSMPENQSSVIAEDNEKTNSVSPEAKTQIIETPQAFEPKDSKPDTIKPISHYSNPSPTEHTYVQGEPASTPSKPLSYNITINLGEKDGVSRSIQKSYQLNEEEKKEKQSFVDDKPLNHPIPEPVPVQQPEPDVEKNAPEDNPPTKVTSYNKPSEANTHEKQPIAIGEKLQASGNAVYEKFLKNANEMNIGERLQQKAISDLRQAIGINEQYLFINELFQGNATAYNESIRKINEASGLENAFNEINIVSERFNWSNEKMMPAIEKFIHLVQRRFLKN